MAKPRVDLLAPVEDSVLTPAADRRRPDPKPLQRAWGALGAATGSALLATIVGPMVASATGTFSMDEIGTAGEGATSDVYAVAPPTYVYLAPGEQAPDGAPVVQLDPITVVTSPSPGTTLIQVKPKPKVVYIYLKPGETPPAGAIVKLAGEVSSVTTPPDSASPKPIASSAPAPTTPDPIATPRPVATPRPIATPRPAPIPPPTKPSGG